MKRQKTVFQMTFVQNRNEDLSVTFSSEQPKMELQSILFFIPLYYTLTKTDNLIKYLKESDIVIPFSINGKVVNLPAKVNFPFIKVDIGKYADRKLEMLFIIGVNNPQLVEKELNKLKSKYILNWFKENLNYISKYTNTDFVTFNYIGKWEQIDKANTKFLALIPLITRELSLLLWELRIFPVGFTPKYGDLNKKY